MLTLSNQIFLKNADIPADIEKSEIPCAAIHFATIDQDTGKITITGLADTEGIVVFHDGHFDIIHADPRMDANEKVITAHIKSYMDQHGGTLQDAMLATMDFMRERASTTNTPGNRGVLNVWDTHTAPDESFANYKTYDAKDVERIIMHSDGIDDRYGLFTYETLIDHSRQKTFENLVAKIREKETADPLGITYPRIKTSDDATIVCALIQPS